VTVNSDGFNALWHAARHNSDVLTLSSTRRSPAYGTVNVKFHYAFLR